MISTYIDPCAFLYATSVQIEHNETETEWWWKIVEATGRVLMQSSPYESRENCERDAKRAEGYIA